MSDQVIFKEIYLEGKFINEDDGTGDLQEVFAFATFGEIFVTIPIEFLAAQAGYGRHYGHVYGQGL